MSNILDPGWFANFYLVETPGSEEVLLYVSKYNYDKCEQYDSLKRGEASIIIAKKIKNRLKLIYSFHGSEAMGSRNGALLTFQFPKKFYAYFKTTGTDAPAQKQYITAIYPDSVTKNEFFDLVSYFHCRRSQ
jgi:hypothetical protein